MTNTATASITVHVTPDQREELALLVNRRMSDLVTITHGTRTRQLTEHESRELVNLSQLKRELSQAGT